MEDSAGGAIVVLHCRGIRFSVLFTRVVNATFGKPNADFRMGDSKVACCSQFVPRLPGILVERIAWSSVC
jgi:hypothetical protein